MEPHVCSLVAMHSAVAFMGALTNFTYLSFGVSVSVIFCSAVNKTEYMCFNQNQVRDISMEISARGTT